MKKNRISNEISSLFTYFKETRLLRKPNASTTGIKFVNHRNAQQFCRAHFVYRSLNIFRRKTMDKNLQKPHKPKMAEKFHYVKNLSTSIRFQ